MPELFAGNQLGYVQVDRWRVWVYGINRFGFFVQSGVPDHRGFETWEEWAMQMVGIMNIQT